MHGCMIPHPCGHTVSPWMRDHHLRLKLGKTQPRVIPPNQTFHHNVDIDQLFKATRLLAKAIAPDGPECVLQTTQGQVSCADLQGTNWTCSLVLEQYFHTFFPTFWKELPSCAREGATLSYLFLLSPSLLFKSLFTPCS